jgi:hypothetical protein
VSRSLFAVFSRPHGQPAKKGPYARLRLEGETARAEPDGPLIAEHQHHSWMVDGERFSRLELEGPVMVHFQRNDGSVSKSYGPFSVFSAVNGVAFKERSVFAFVDREMNDWYCHDDGHHWPLMVIEPAD